MKCKTNPMNTKEVLYQYYQRIRLSDLAPGGRKGEGMNKCGNKDCSVSSGIHGSYKYPGFTFGSGALDQHGYWSIPCSICAREHEKNHPEDGPCWPFEAKKGERG